MTREDEGKKYVNIADGSFVVVDSVFMKGHYFLNNIKETIIQFIDSKGKCADLTESQFNSFYELYTTKVIK